MKAKNKIKIPEALAGFGIDWSDYIPEGGWEFYNAFQKDFIPLIVEAEKRRDVARKNLANMRNAFYVGSDQCEQLARCANDVAVRLQTIALLSGGNMFEVYEDALNVLRNEKRGQDIATLRGAFTAIGFLRKIADEYKMQVEEKTRGFETALEQHIRTADVLKAIGDYHHYVDEVGKHLYALRYSETKYKTKIFRELARIVVCAVTVIKILHESDGRWVKEVNDVEGMRKVFDDSQEWIVKVARDCVKAKARLKKHGEDFWRQGEIAMIMGGGN